MPFLGSFALNIAKKHPNLLTKVLTTKMNENGNFEEHFSLLENIVLDLRAAGVQGVTDKQLVAMIETPQ